MTDFTFNSVTAVSKGFTLINIQKPIIPVQKEIVIDSPAYQGVISSSKKFVSTDITVEGVLIGTSASDLLTKLKAFAAFLYSDSDKVLTFDDESDRYYNASHIDTVITKRTYRYCFMNLKFRCNDPFAYATSADTDTQTGIVVKDTTWTISNGGHYYAFPTITITFNASHSHLYLQNNNITDNRFDISKSFVNTDVLVLNTKDRTITLNGTSSPVGFGTGGSAMAEFILMATGSNQLQIGTTGANINVDVVTAFNKTYLY